MLKVVVFVHAGQGSGDYSHFQDIVQYIKNNPTMQVEMVAVMNTSKSKLDFFRQKLNKLDIPFFIDSTNTQYNNQELQKHLAEADQILLISHGAFPGFRQFEEYFKSNAIVKFIAEHEGITESPQTLKSHPIIIRAMGLSDAAYGIKIGSTTSSKEKPPLSIIEKNDSSFFNKLMQYTQSTDSSNFTNNNFLIPAYFSKMLDFMRFLLVFSINETLPKNKNFVVALSGIKSFREKLRDALEGEEGVYQFNFLKTTDIKSIQLINPNEDDPEIFLLNPSGHKVIYIFDSFYISDESYKALYQCSPLLAGVSGDNTFEMAVTFELLPWYWSTNFTYKIPTLNSLYQIARTELDLKDNITEKLKDDMSLFLNYESYDWTYVKDRVFPDKKNEMIEKFKNLDLIGINKLWHEITSYLAQNYNFYDNLKAIFFENLQSPKEPNISAKKNFDVKLSRDLYFFKISIDKKVQPASNDEPSQKTTLSKK